MDIKSDRLLPGITSGLVVGLVEVILGLSFAALIYIHELSKFLSISVLMVLVGVIVGGVLVTVLSTLPGTVSGIQDAPSAITGVMAAGVVASIPHGASDQEIFITVVLVVALTTTLCGVFMLGMGYFNLGGLVRFLPYPVVGGFLAGTGWLLMIGSIEMMTDIIPSLAELPNLFQPEVVLLWLPGLVFAVIMFVVLMKYSHYLLLAGLIFGAILLFFLVIWMAGISISEASEMGWLLGPFPEIDLLQSISFSDVAGVNWGLIFTQTGSMVTVFIISAITLLLNASGVELAAREDMDLNHELRAAGIANIFSGFSAGLIGFHQLSLTVMNLRLKARTRLTGLVAAAVCIAALIAGTTFISYFPRFILGGLLLFLGFEFLYEWVYETWFKLPKSDYAVIILILVVIASVGFLEGVAVGIVAAVILFAINYSRVNVVKHSLTAATYQSTISRPKLHQRILSRYGKQVLILELQGYIFFGTANQLLEQIRAHIEQYASTHLCFLVIDFAHVTGLDSSVVISFRKMIQLLEDNDSSIVLSGLSAENQSFLEKTGVLSSKENTFVVMPDLDHGIEWCENALLSSTGVFARHTQRSLQEQLKDVIGNAQIVSRIMDYLELQELSAGVHLIQQGDSPGFVYFLEEGLVTAQLETPGQDPVRVNTMSSENLVGELGFYLGTKRNASVVSETPIKVYRLTAESLTSMEANDPEAAAAFHKFIVHVMAEKLSHVMSTVETLMR